MSDKNEIICTLTDTQIELAELKGRMRYTMEVLELLSREAETVFNYLEKIEPYEPHEMALDTPNPDSYWIPLNEAKSLMEMMSSTGKLKVPKPMDKREI